MSDETGVDWKAAFDAAVERRDAFAAEAALAMMRTEVVELAEEVADLHAAEAAAGVRWLEMLNRQAAEGWGKWI